MGFVIAVLVAEDQAWRLSYWRSMGFTPHTSYYPLSLITSATNGTTSIPGLLTIDWLQVVLLAIVIVDGFIVLGILRGRRVAPVSAAEAPLL